MAIDTTMVCALHRDGTPRERKERTYPELLGPRGRAQLVVVALEVGGRWSEETRGFVSGACDGVACWLTQQPVQSLLPCSTYSIATAVMGPHLTRTRWTETTAVRDWLQGELV